MTVSVRRGLRPVETGRLAVLLFRLKPVQRPRGGTELAMSGHVAATHPTNHLGSAAYLSGISHRPPSSGGLMSNISAPFWKWKTLRTR